MEKMKELYKTLEKSVLKDGMRLGEKLNLPECDDN
jgi:hypothetical protein